VKEERVQSSEIFANGGHSTGAVGGLSLSGEREENEKAIGTRKERIDKHHFKSGTKAKKFTTNDSRDMSGTGN
jgi:hypothetical protein